MSLFDNNSYLTRVVLIPSAVFLSAIFGGAYGSGREVVEFMTRYGPIGGLLSIVAIALAFAGCLFICFEIARLTRAYDYHAFGRVLLRGASPLYEAVLIIALLLALAINATASGTLIAGPLRLSARVGRRRVLAGRRRADLFRPPDRRGVDGSRVRRAHSDPRSLGGDRRSGARRRRRCFVLRDVSGSRRHRRGALGGARHRRADPAAAVLRPRLADAARSRRGRRSARGSAVSFRPSSFICASCCCIRRSSTTSCRRIG